MKCAWRLDLTGNITFSVPSLLAGQYDTTCLRKCSALMFIGVFLHYKRIIDTNFMETRWWPGSATIIVTSVGSLMVVFMLLMLLFLYVPRLRTWLTSTVSRNGKCLYKADSPETSEANECNRSDNQHQSVQHPNQHPRCRPSRPCSLPCLPEEKLYFPSSGPLPVRPSSLRPSAPSDTTATGLPELIALSDRGCVQHKLNLALHSDGSEASNSSSSASAVNDEDHQRCGTEGVLRQRKDFLHQHNKPPSNSRHSCFESSDFEEFDEWSAREREQHNSSFADTATDCDESMVDIKDLSSNFGESGSASAIPATVPHSHKCGSVDLGLTYYPNAEKLSVRIIELRNLQSVRSSSLQLRLLLLPDRKQRHRTKIRSVTDNCIQISETFTFTRIEPDELSSMGLRFRLYSSERLRRERLLGEAFLGLASLSLNIQQEHQLVISLDAKADFKKSIASLGRSTSSSGCSSKGDISPAGVAGSTEFELDPVSPRSGIPEVLLGLAYNGTTGRLSVEILRASGLKSQTSSRPPVVCIKMLLLSNTSQELGRAKTSMKKSHSNPTFLETFMFQVTMFQLAEVTLLLSVINKRSMKRRELLGWLSLGFDSSSEQQAIHWQEMREASGEQVCHWHSLLSS